MTQTSEIDTLREEILHSRKILTALGDEVRQHLILVMMADGDCTGMRVNDIAAKTNLSRPAVSHHLQILKDAGIICVRREGTKNYYYFNSDSEAFDSLIHMLEHARTIMASLPERRDQND